ncbi:MAG: hypothetical protein P4L39_10150 [Humidesulfovibrio sp.]|nr:hypothetical protein [Humidesulfovibrio sp.]
MRVKALVLAQSSTQTADARWDSPLAGRGVLERTIENAAACPVIDEVVIATDLPGLLARNTLAGARISEIPANMRAYNFTFLDVSLGRLSMERCMLQEMDCEAEVVFHISWKLPLFSPRSLERIFHTLLDSPVAARVLPISPVDPGLFTQQPGATGFFPVWHAPGVDRQRIPQLFRPGAVAVSHAKRLGQGIPSVTGVRIARRELVTIESARDLPLAAYLLEQQPAG